MSLCVLCLNCASMHPNWMGIVGICRKKLDASIYSFKIYILPTHSTRLCTESSTCKNFRSDFHSSLYFRGQSKIFIKQKINFSIFQFEELIWNAVIICKRPLNAKDYAMIHLATFHSQSIHSIPRELDKGIVDDSTITNSCSYIGTDKEVYRTTNAAYVEKDQR